MQVGPQALWVRFRQLPLWLQVIAWVVAWPVVGGLAIWRADPSSNGVRAGAAAVLIIGGLAWFPALAGAGGDSNGAAGAGDDVTAQPGTPTDGSEVAEPSPEPTTPSPTPFPTPSPTADRSPTAEQSPTAIPSPSAPASPSPSAEPVSAGPRGDDAPVVVQGRVVDIVDGDTIDLANGTRVRLAISDTPEVHGGIEECGPEASDFTGRFLAGQTVAVYRPASAPLTDRFGRTVGEVVRVTDGASLNVALVRAGLAEIDERFTSEDPDLARRLRNAAADAASPECGSVAAAPIADDTLSEAPDVASGGHTGKTDGGWTCHPAYEECLPQVSDLDCGEIGHQVTLRGSDDPYRLDGNSTSRDDGDGCESSAPWSPSKTYPYY